MNGERERGRVYIDADAGADTKTTSKMRKRKSTKKKNKKGNRDPQVAQRAPKKRFLATARNPHADPDLNLNILEHPDER